MSSGKSYRFGGYRLDSPAGLLRRGAAVVPLPPKVARTLLLLVENAGDVVDKQQLFKEVWQDAFIEEGSLTRTISVLRKTLGGRKAGHQFITTISKRGYRFAAPVETIENKQPVLPAGKIMLAVLPMENLSGDRQQDYFSDGLTEEMITQLGRLNPEHLGVIARTSAMLYKNSGKSAVEIGRELGVAYLLEGSVRRAGKRIRIAAQLIQARDETHVWAESYERNLHDILNLQSDVARAVANEIKVKLTPQQRERLTSADVVVPQAYEAYLKGRFLLNRRTQDASKKSIQYFEQAIRHDPHYPLAHAGLADSYLALLDLGHLSTREATNKAKAAAGKALKMDEALAEVHASLGHAHFHEFDWPAAERDFQRAIELNPNYANSHFYYANYLIAVGRMEEAIAEARYAQALDPVSLAAGTNLAAILYHTGHYKGAVEQSLKVLEIDRTFARAYEDLGRAYEQQGRYAQAVAAFENAVAYSGRSSRDLASLAHAYAVAGNQKEAVKLLQELKQISKKGYVSPYAFALVAAGLGNKRRAFDWLAKAYTRRDAAMPFLKVNPRLAPLHADSRFQALLRRMNFPG